MQLEMFLERLEGVKKHGQRYMARCPAHEDRTPSLSVWDDHERINLKCFAGCPGDAVWEALGLTWKDAMHEELRTHEEPDAVYPYTDEHGALLFEVVRFPGKQFRQRQPNGDWNLNGTRRVLYHLPEVVYGVERGKTIYVVEGEKDADKLRTLGKVATTNPGGAGKWRTEYTSCLLGANVIVVADRDEVGLHHAITVSQSLEGLANKKGVVQPVEGKDISDHLKAGHAIEELVRVEEQQIQRHYQPLNLFVPTPAVDWVIENIVVGGEATLLVADGGQGKSFFALAASLAVAGGVPFLDNRVRMGRVLYVDEEGSPALALQRLAQLGATELQKRNLDYLNFTGVDLVRYPERLIEDVDAIHPVLVVIDSYAKAARGAEENSNDQMSRVWDEGILRLARTSGAAVLVIHHTSMHGGGPRGATQIRNSADQVLSMKRQEDGSQIIYASKPRRRTNKIHFDFQPTTFGGFELIPHYDY